MCLVRGGVGGEGVDERFGFVWALAILWEQGDFWMCVSV